MGNTTGFGKYECGLGRRQVAALEKYNQIFGGLAYRRILLFTESSER
jgi:hypothetical protein